MKSLQGKRILITGPARGIGAEMARQLSGYGAKLALVGLEVEQLKTLQQELGSQHIWFECDVTDVKAVDQAVKKSIEAFGGLDVVVCNAGISAVGTVAITPAEVMNKVVGVNLLGVMNTVSAALPAITESRGYIFMISSAAALNCLPGMAPYSASKIAVDHFGNCLRLEVGHKGVDIGVGVPAWIDTDLVRDQLNDFKSFNELLVSMPWPLNYVTSVEECASSFVKAIVYRKKKQYVPGALAITGLLRPFFKGAIWDFFISLNAATHIPRLEEEVKTVGRFFGPNSLGNDLSKKEKS